MTGSGWIGCRAVTVAMLARKAAWLTSVGLRNAAIGTEQSISRITQKSLRHPTRSTRSVSGHTERPRLYSHDRNKAGPGNNAQQAWSFWVRSRQLKFIKQGLVPYVGATTNATSIA